MFKQKLVKRDVSLKVLDASEPRQSGQVSKIGIALKEGISSEDAKKISKLIRDEGPKGVKAQIQGDELRVSSKKRDDLQADPGAGARTGLRLRGAVHQLPLNRLALVRERAHATTVVTPGSFATGGSVRGPSP